MLIPPRQGRPRGSRDLEARLLASSPCQAWGASNSYLLHCEPPPRPAHSPLCSASSWTACPPGRSRHRQVKGKGSRAGLEKPSWLLPSVPHPTSPLQGRIPLWPGLCLQDGNSCKLPPARENTRRREGGRRSQFKQESSFGLDQGQSPLQRGVPQPHPASPITLIQPHISGHRQHGSQPCGHRPPQTLHPAQPDLEGGFLQRSGGDPELSKSPSPREPEQAGV